MTWSNNDVYRFGAIPEEFQKTLDDQYYFTIVVDYSDQEIKIKDSCNRMVPLCFEDIKELRKVLKLISKSLKHDR
jgi:hypothetical protein